MTGPTAATPGVVILQWPSDAMARDELRRQGVPRLLVLEAGELPPALDDDLEDWTWLPADERDVFARARDLEARAARSTATAGEVSVGDDGSALVAGTRIPLPAAEAALLRVLADPPERLCSRELLERAVWGDAPRVRRALDSRVFTLRRRLEPAGVAILAVRGRGFVLTPPAPQGR